MLLSVSQVLAVPGDGNHIDDTDGHRTVREKGNACKFFRLRTRTPSLGKMDTAPLRAVVAAHTAAAVAPTPEGVTSTIAASAPLIRATAVAPAPLGSAPVLRMSAPWFGF